MSKPLTAIAVAKLKPQAQRREIPDASCPGLHLIIQPTGAKSWALRFRRPDGRTCKLTLGTVYIKPPDAREPDAPPAIGGHLTLAAAHRLATELRHQIAMGRDPAAAHIIEKRNRRADAERAATAAFSSGCLEYVEHVSEGERVRRWPELARTLGVDPKTRNLVEGGLAQRWATRPVVTIDGHDIHAVVDEARKLGIPGLDVRTDGVSESRARKLFSALSGLFGWLLRQRRVAANPCASVSRPEAPKARDRVLNDGEIVALWRATETIGGPAAAALKLLLLTGGRLREVASMRRDELSDDGAVWTLPSARTKNRRPHVVPLPLLARDIIAALPRIEGCPYVFTNDGRKPVSGWSKIKPNLDAAMQPAAPWVLHDLRRTFVTGLAELGIRPDVIELCVNHAGGARSGVAGTYNRSELMSERRAALERWAAHVAGLVEGRPANVVELRA